MSEAKVVKNQSGQSKSGKAFQLTLNEIEYFGEVRDYLLGLKQFQYIIACKEKAPSTGHEHIHIYVQFKDSVKLSMKKLKGGHLEKCRGSPQQNKAYIEKDGDIIYEKGEMKKKGGKTIEDVKKMAPEEREKLPIQLYNIVQKIEEKEGNDLDPEESYKGKVQVHWYWGESGAGKTRHAMKEMKGRKYNMLKYENGFWHGIGEAEIALYDDWRDTHMKPTELINFIDYYIHPMNIKGGSVKNKYKEIYITSIQDPEKIYNNMPEEYKKQWLRRIREIIHFEIEEEKKPST